MPSLRQGSVFSVLLLQTEPAFALSCNTRLVFDDLSHKGRNAVLPALAQLCSISQTSNAGNDFVWFLLSSGHPLRGGCVSLKLVLDNTQLTKTLRESLRECHRTRINTCTYERLSEGKHSLLLKLGGRITGQQQ